MKFKVEEVPIIRLVDANTFGNVKAAEDLAHRIIDAGVEKRLVADVRADTVVRHPQLFELWRRAGLSVVVIGFEEIDDQKLAYFNKRSSHETHLAAIRILKEIGIRIVGDFIVSTDYEHEDFGRLHDVAAASGIDLPMPAILTPILLSHYGLDLSEAMAFGVGTGLFFAYLPFIRLNKLPLTTYRCESGGIFKRVAKRLGCRMDTRKFSDPEKSMAALDEKIAAGTPVGCRTGAYWLPYFPPAFRLGTAVKSYEQASMFGPISIVIAAAMGGIMVPVYAMPKVMQQISIISPMAWAQNAFLEIFVRGGNLRSVLPHIALLLIFALTCIVAAWLLFNRRTHKQAG